MEPAWVDEDDDRVADGGIIMERPFIIRNVDDDLGELVDRTHQKLTRKCLRERYITTSIYGKGTPKWAKPEDDERNGSSSALNALTRFAGNTNIGSKSLPAKELKFTLLRDPTIGHQQGTVNCLKFHPSMPILVSATSTGRIALFQLCDDVQNLLLRKSNFFLQDVTIPNISFDYITFFNEGSSLFASANNQNYCYVYDLLSGEIKQIKQPKGFK
uniref:WD_REPEATS_REGION domain-containing protein n=1 Tax=Meloidogyne hapla TaxID=6305 RepID=A0A1I8C151_MELHA